MVFSFYFGVELNVGRVVDISLVVVFFMEVHLVCYILWSVWKEGTIGSLMESRCTLKTFLLSPIRLLDGSWLERSFLIST